MMTFNIVGFTEQEFFDSVGGITNAILSVLQAASFGSLRAAARDRASYPAKTLMEVRTVASFEEGGLPQGFEQYMELFYLNNPALAECQAAGMRLQVIGTTQQVPENAGVVVRLPLYLHRDALATRNLENPPSAGGD